VKKHILPIINMLIVLIAVLLTAVTFFNRNIMGFFFSYMGYYLVLLLFFLWLVVLCCCVYHYRPSIKEFLRKYGPGVIFSLILCLIVFNSIEPSFRVLSDETNLLAVSKSMTYERRTDNVTTGFWYYNNFYPDSRTAPKRPLLFPFLTNIVHTFLGYKPTNVFILNFFVLFAMLFIIYSLVKVYMGHTIAISSMVVVASQPIVTQNATSGGFELLACLFLLLSFMCLKWFLGNPEPLRFQLLWVTLLMLSNIRYEGILFFAMVIGILALFKRIKVEYLNIKTNFVYFCTPLILLLTFWQRLLVRNQFEGVSRPFGMDYFMYNNFSFLSYLFDYSFFRPYATLASLLGLISIIYFAILFIGRRLRLTEDKKELIIISSACVLVNWVLFTAYHGQIGHPASGRFFAFFFILLSIFAVLLVSRVRLFRAKPAYVLVLSIIIFILYHPVSVQDRFSRTLTLPRKYRFVTDFLTKEAKKSRNFLVIDNRPGQYTVWDYGAINFPQANRDRNVINRYKNHLYERIFVVQDIEYKTGKPSKSTDLNKNFTLKTISEMQNDSSHFTRISEVISVK
jgi:hypothetical protein